MKLNTNKREEMKMEEKQKKKYNKKLLIPLFVIFTMGLVLATGFIVNSITIQSDVYEAFDGMEYYIIGDGGTWDGVSDCSIVNETDWVTLSGVVDMQGLFAGEGRMLCARFNNLGEADLTYTISNTIVTGNGNTAECIYAFGENSVTGTATALGSTVDGYGIVVPMDATPVNDCQLEISLIRG